MRSKGSWGRAMRGIGAAALVACTLEVAAADPARLRLSDDFEGEGFGAASGLFYKDNEEQRAGRYRTQTDIARSGRQGLELSVVPQCPVDRKGCSERAEVWEKPDVLAPYHAALWYAFSMKLDDPPPSAAHRYMVAQWKRAILPGADGDYSPFLGIRIIRGSLALTIDSDAMPSRPRGPADPPFACADGAAPADQREETRQTRALITVQPDAPPQSFAGYDVCAPDLRIIRRGGALPKAEPRWIDFVIKVKPGPGGDGEIEIFANGAWIVSVKGRIGHEGPGLGPTQYFKFGPYRDGGQNDRWRVFYDDFRRGPECRDVAGPEVCGQLDAT
jgi:hypothetical protein